MAIAKDNGNSNGKDKDNSNGKSKMRGFFAPLRMTIRIFQVRTFYVAIF